MIHSTLIPPISKSNHLLKKCSSHIITLAIILLVQTCTFVTFAQSSLTIDTITIKVEIPISATDTTITYVTARDSINISTISSPTLSSLWIATINSDTVQFQNLVTDSFLSYNASTVTLEQSSQLYQWIIYDNNTKIRSAVTPGYIFSVADSLGYASASVDEDLNLVTYQQQFNIFQFQLDSNYIILNTDTSKTFLSVFSQQRYRYIPESSANNPTISDTLDIPYVFQIVNDSTAWITIQDDTIYAAPLDTPQLARYATVLITAPSQQQTLTLSISQWENLGNVSLNHVTGLSGRPKDSRGLQQTSEYIKTIYALQNSKITLYLPSHNGGSPMQSYYCWYNYENLETINSNLVLSNNFRSFNNNSGKYCLGYTGDNFTYNVNNVTFPVQLACDASNYTDYNLRGRYFYEPTIGCRYIFIIEDANVLAQEIQSKGASGTAPTEYYENYNMIIPTNQIVRLVTEYNLTGSTATYFAYNKSGTVETVSNIKLYINNTLSSLTITKNKYIQLYYPKTLGNATYQVRGSLSDGTIVNIAQFNLNFVNSSELGPVVVGGSNMLADNEQLVMEYNYLGGNWFYNLSHNAPFDPFSDCDLGFCYNTSYRAKNPKKLSSNAFASCFEYQFLTTSTSAYSSGIKQGVTAVDFKPLDYIFGTQLSPGFLYVNTGGNIVNLCVSSFTPPNKDPNTDYFATMYINNLCLSSGQNPQLTFYVEELKDSNYIPVTQYSSGELVMKTGTWYQIGFPFNLTEPVGDNYRVRVVNNGADWYTSTYALDQFGIYQKIPAVYPYGVYQDCSTMTDTIKSVAVRFDYEQTNIFSTNTDSLGIYYQCTDSFGNIIPLYYNNIQGVNQYGYVMLKNLPTATANYPVYSSVNDSTSLQKYLATMTTDSLTGAYYTKDTVIDVERYLFYFLFQSTSMDACQPYTISLYSSSSLSSSSLIGKGTFVPIGECVYAVDDNTWTNVNTGICATTSTDLTITQHVMVSESTPVIVNGYYDWLIGSAVDYQSNGCYDQYNYNSIIAALEALHSDTTYISNKTMPTSANAAISATQIALLDSLISDGLLTLYKQRLTVTIYDSVTYFTVYPYHSTTTPDGVITGMDLCKTPWTIKIPLSDKAPWLRLGKQNETFITTGLNYIREARISNTGVNSSGFVLPVKGSSYKTIPTAAIGSMILKSTTDTTLNAYIGDTIFSKVILRSYTDGIEIVTTGRKADFPTLNNGYTYTTWISLNATSTDCSNGYQLVDLIPQPDILYWTGTESSSWNNINNWQPGTALGAITPSTLNNFVPLYNTNVVISNASNTPTLYENTTDDTGQTTSLLRDLSYVSNQCQNIYFASHASLIGQEYLYYDSVWIDVKIPTKQWSLMTAPTRGLVSGDWYVATSASQTSVFSSLDSCNSRSTTPFWQSVYNSYIEVQDFNGNVTVSNAGWSSPANGMNTAFSPRTGFCVWPGNNNISLDTVMVRLPKADKRYYYYNASDQPTAISIQVDRPTDYYKLSFIDQTWDNVPTISIFDEDVTLGLTGNPFMATLYMKPFMEDNTTLTGNYWIVSDKTIEACNVSGESTTGSTTVVNIEPMQGFFVEVVTGNKFSPANLTFATVATYPTTASQSPQQSSQQVSRLRINATYGNYQSKALLLMKPTANNHYEQSEDVPLLTLSPAMTPSSIYTVADNKALQINSLSSIQRVPLLFRINDSANRGSTFRVEFNGSSTFEGKLYLLDLLQNKLYPIEEESIFELELPNQNLWRYFITHAPEETATKETSQGLNIMVYTPQPGVALIISTHDIRNIKIYDTIGRLIQDMEPKHSNNAQVTLPSGMYLFTIMTSQGVETHPIVVK